MQRRKFIQVNTLALGSLAILSFLTDQVGSVGIQLFSIPKVVEKDLESTFRQLSEMGYREIEFYGPYDFSAQATKDGWNKITGALGFSASGYYGKSPKEMAALLKKYNLSSPSMHIDLVTLDKHLDETAEAANQMGTKYVIIPSAETQPDLDGYKRQADQFNSLGEKIHQKGLKFCYHNHGNGIVPIDGISPLEMIIERTDPNYVTYEMDIYWTIAGGADPVALFEKFKGRYKLMHIKDMTKKVRFSGDGGNPQEWMSLFPYLEDAGSGVLDIKSILAAAKKSGVEHFIIERDLAPEGLVNMKKGIDFVKNVQV
ncbi:MAG: sugar phosphate isomerase/epimerase family protein [Flavitalea sp.]